jgi:ATPase subunit of ABC transporter with duplicated ATPase domains
VTKNTDSKSNDLHSVTTSASSLNHEKMVKKSKKDKRFEKEEQLEKEKQAKLLQERIVSEKEKKKHPGDETTMETIHAEASSQPAEQQPKPTTASAAATASLGGSASAAVSKCMSCNTCGGSFYDTKEYRDHFK